MSERVFTMDLAPLGRLSKIVMDGENISGLLRGVVVRSSVSGATTVELEPAHGQRAQLVAKVAGPNIVISDDEICRQLAPWLNHHSTCSRHVDAGKCDCGLNAMLARLKGIEAP